MKTRLLGWVCLLSMGVVGCLTRPIISGAPTTKESFSATVRQQAVDKVDLLFMIDNSGSMGDKQALLALAVPDLVAQLVTPKNGEFEPVHDMHIGVISSSLGATDACNTSVHGDDRGHLLNRTKSASEAPVTDAAPQNFLAWLPDNPKNAGKPIPPNAVAQSSKLEQDFADLVVGVQENGCGLEAQLESWYRFLVQPDPYQSIQVDTSSSLAQLVGVDETLLAQRKDFLRPDSLLAVIVVTDEEDSWSDPMWRGGQGWRTRYQKNGWSTGGQLPRATSACDADANSPDCKQCGDPGTSGDPSCVKGLYTQAEDILNVRYTDDMKRRYGISPQFPIQRYVDGLRAALVPDRSGKSCTNPIYAGKLPADAKGDLCHLARGPRTSDLVFFAVIGGIPVDLVQANVDWTKVLGRDPQHFDKSGIDPRMIQSTTPRGVAGDWNTATSNGYLDLQYACTFDLQQPKDCSAPNAGSCDCGRRDDGVYSSSPLCAPNPNDGMRPTLQVRGKAYPTIRELRVAKGMDENGIVASLCPKTLDPKSEDFGYRPAVRAIIDRLKTQLGGQCLPQPLERGADGKVSCSILTLVPGTAAEQATACPPRGSPDGRGLQQPDPQVLAGFNQNRLPDEIQPVCELTQLSGMPSCDNNGTPGWCYVEGAAAGLCKVGSNQAIKFGAPPTGPTVIQCVQQTSH